MTTTTCTACGGGIFVTEFPDESDDGTTVWSHVDEGCDDPTPGGAEAGGEA